MATKQDREASRQRLRDGIKRRKKERAERPKQHVKQRHAWAPPGPYRVCIYVDAIGRDPIGEPVCDTFVDLPQHFETLEQAQQELQRIIKAAGGVN